MWVEGLRGGLDHLDKDVVHCEGEGVVADFGVKDGGDGFLWLLDERGVEDRVLASGGYH